MNRQPIRVCRASAPHHNILFSVYRFCGWKNQAAQGLQHEQRNWYIGDVRVTEDGLSFRFREDELISDAEIAAMRAGVMWLRGQPNDVCNLIWEEGQTNLVPESGRTLDKPSYRLDMTQSPPRPIGA